MTVTLAIEALAGFGLLALIVTAGAQLLLAAGSADDHLKRATDAQPVNRIRSAASIAAAVAARSQRIAGGAPPPDAPVTSTSAIDAGEQQLFAQLQNYYAANIKQGSTIFWATLLAMCLGFAIVFIGVVVAGINSVTAIVAAIAGVLSQFIAATFLVALRSTQAQATTYAQSLVTLHERELTRLADERNIDLGLGLLNEISGDRTDPANAARAAIAMGLIVRQAPTIVEPPAVAVDVPPASEPGTGAGARARTATITFDDTAVPERR